MRVSNEEMKKTHVRLLEGSARLLRERGIESTSVQDVMGGAGMKNGGFYRHFNSKEDLVDSALQAAFEQVVSFAESRVQKLGRDEVLPRYRAYYLSEAHVNDPGNGCPVAALAGDIARAGEPLKSTFSAGLNRMVDVLSEGMSGSAAERRRQAMREIAALAGAVVIARACDEKTKRAVLSACRRA